VGLVAPVLVSLLVLLPVGCGPVEYLGQVSSRAAHALAQAELADAEHLAPYEYTRAREYLRKAREEAGYSSFENAANYGRRCEEMAGKARALAREQTAAAAPAATEGRAR
jgi:hypothetical protein